MFAPTRRRALSASLVVAFVAVLCSLPASPASAAPVPFADRSVSSTVDGAREVTTADIDGDGDLDIVSGSEIDTTVSWFINDGTPDTGSWTEVLITTSSKAFGVDTGDIDRDGDIDVASANFNEDNVEWYVNDGTPEDPAWTTVVVTTAIVSGVDIEIVDLDRDGDQDILTSSTGDDTVGWYENDGTPLDPTWTERVIFSGTPIPQGVAVGDIDKDGDLDVVTEVAFAGDIDWFINDGTPLDGGWTTFTLEPTWGIGNQAQPADIDSDGDLDVMAADVSNGQVTWWENDGTPAVDVWSPHPMADVSGTGEGARALAIGDLDDDGDLDAVVGEGTLTAGGADSVVWLENDGTPATGAWVVNAISTAPDSVQNVAVGDLDDDGDLDVISNGHSDDSLQWHENDPTLPTPTLRINDRSIAEGNTGTKNAVFAVTRTNAANQTTKVRFVTRNGSATAPRDFVETFGVLTFTPGQVTKTITVRVRGDVIREGNEVYLVKLFDADNATITDATGKGTIRNND